jgi:hypothetical protein
MSEFSQADLTCALSDYRAVVAEAMEVVNAWHEELEAGESPSTAQITAFQAGVAALNERAKRAWDHYCQIGALLYRL